jgi:hypothetical protein
LRGERTIISASIAANKPHMHRGHYCAPIGTFSAESMATLALSGPAAERLFCGEITDDSDQIDMAMAREYLARPYEPALILVELNRHRAAADRLVITEQSRIRRIADALLRRGALRGAEISSLFERPRPPAGFREKDYSSPVEFIGADAFRRPAGRVRHTLIWINNRKAPGSIYRRVFPMTRKAWTGPW